nr:DUF1206 domain-containing protein [Nostoc sp. FACHB-190]
MHRMLERIEISLKKTLHASEKDTERVQLLRLQFWLQLHGILAEDLVFLDESGDNLSLDGTQARGLGGALTSLAQQPFVPWILGIVALGLIAYGIYSVIEARYRHINNL